MEHCNPEEPAFTIESFGFNPLENTGRDWYNPPVGELIYKEYGNEESRSTYYIAGRAINVRLINACSLEELEELQALQAVGKPYEESFLLYIPLYVFFAIGPCLQFSYIAWNLRRGSSKQIAILVFKLKPPGCLSCSLAFVVIFFIYPAYNRQKESHGKLLIAIFAPVIGVITKVISRISVQQLWNITLPGYSYVLLVPTYFGAAVVTRGLQAELDTLVYIATLGVIHGFAEVVERSTMMVVDHFCYRLWKRSSASWGSFQTSRRERLNADTAIMSMMFESAAIISVNGLLLFYQLIYLQSDSFSNLLVSFAIYTSVPLVIEWFFTSVSLAIETRYQNMPVMAVWRKQWKRHFLVAFLNAIPLATWSSEDIGPEKKNNESREALSLENIALNSFRDLSESYYLNSTK
ncbi:hypothetical protein AWC38_SpisGene16420 [Stylophora pistillata]|uniref:Uncharacterized protein n=1 Tax=Stylophora pistillata TaxID=50429 RepID=A0A2B4RPR5_STYPI|nr:hypothetical protein AWC38_SpisGene16420 [Stylophora pistillata]